MQQDFIMRMIEQLTQTIVAIMTRRKAGEYKEAREQAKVAARYLFKADVDLLLLYGDDYFLHHFKDIFDHLETEKCMLSAELFNELAFIEEAENNLDAGMRLKAASLYLYTSVIPIDRDFQTTKHIEKAALLIAELKEHSLSEKKRISLQLYENFLLKF